MVDETDSGNYEIEDNVVRSKMVYPKEILNRLRWDEGENLEDATIWYVHRGAPGDLGVISGSEVASLEKGFMQVGEAYIPYHRITRIEYRGEVIFDKEAERARGSR